MLVSPPAQPKTGHGPAVSAGTPLWMSGGLAQFHRLVEQSFEAITLLTPDGTILYSTPPTTKLLGYPLDEFIGRNAFDLVHPEDRAFAIEQLQRAVDTPGSAIAISARAKHKDGTWRRFDAIFTNLLMDPDVGAIVVNLRETPERTWSEVELANQVSLIDNVLDAIISTDMHRTVKSWNRAAEEMYGWTAAEAIGQNTDTLLSSNLTLAQLTAVWQGRLVHHKKDGTPIHVMAFVRLLYDVQGQPLGLVSVHRDITELVRAETIIRQNDRLLALFVEHAPAAIAMFDANMRYLAVSRRFIADYRLGNVNVIGLEHYETFPEIPERWRAIHRRCLAGATEKSDRDPFLREDGTTDWIRWEMIPWRTGSGEVGGVILFSELITDEIKTEQAMRALNADLEARVAERTAELATANKELESFSYSVSHDLRAPLRHVAGYVELLQREAGTHLDDKSRRYLQVITQSTERMGNLIDDLLEFSRVGRTELAKADFDMAHVVREAIAELESETRDRAIEWCIESLPVVYADRSMLRRVWVNLVENALKYSRPRAQTFIEIGQFLEEGGTGFFIRDNGVGFDDKYVDKLFGVFQRLHTAAQFEGTGIGLANVRHIINRHGGRVWAESKLDTGAAFYFTLPGKDAA